MRAKERAPVVVLCLLPGQAVATGTNRGGLELWNLGSGTCRQDLVGHHGRIKALHLVDSGRTLVSLDEQRHLRLWDLPGMRCRVHIDRSDHEGIFRLLAVSDDGARGFSVSDRGHGCLWNLTRGDIERHVELVFSAAPVRVEFGPGSRQTVHVELEDRSWAALDLTKSACSPELPPPAVRYKNGHPTYQVAVVEDRIVLRRRDDGRQVLVLEGHDEPVLCAALSPDARSAVSGDAGGTIRLWRLEMGPAGATAR